MKNAFKIQQIGSTTKIVDIVEAQRFFFMSHPFHVLLPFKSRFACLLPPFATAAVPIILRTSVPPGGLAGVKHKPPAVKSPRNTNHKSVGL